MPSGILRPQPTEGLARLYHEVNELKKRVAELEGRPVVVPIGTGAPSAATGQDGQIAGDATHIYLKIAGAWKAVAVS